MPEQVSISPTIVWQDVVGDLVLFDRGSGGYHALDAIASAIWRAIASGLTVPGIAAALARDYDCPAHVIASDIDQFIADAIVKGLLIDAGGTS